MYRASGQPPEPGPSGQAGREPAGLLERQRVLLHDMLRVTLEQRRHLIDADVRGLEAANQRLSRLLERQQELHRELHSVGDAPDPQTLTQLRCLADRLKVESRANYLLACRGAQFADLSLSLLQGGGSSGDDAVAPEGMTSRSRRLALVDARR
jgi:hypothetical protein